MDRTSWKPKIYKATEAVDHKESLQDVHDSPPIVDSAKHIMKGQIQAYNDNPTPEGDSYGKPQGYPWQYGEENNSVYDYEASWKNATLKTERLYLLLVADKSLENNLIVKLVDKNWEDLPYELQQKIKSAGVHWNLGEAKATEEYSALYSGKCKRCGQRKEVTNVSGTWTNAISDQKYPDGNIPSPTCLDCYYDIYGEPDGDPDIGIMESKANEDDHKKSWDKLDSIAKQGFSDIGYDQQSWDSDPEEVRAEMETVVKDNMSQENWKDVANKIYKEELNKGKKSGGEAKLKAGYAQCPHCSTQMNRLDWLQDHIKTSHPTKANEDVGDSWYTRIVKCDQCDGQGSLDDYDRPAWSAGMRGTTKCWGCDGTGEKEETEIITDPYVDLHYMNESKVKRYKVGDDYYDDLDDAKLMSDVTGYAVFDNDNWGKMVYDGESKASEYYTKEKIDDEIRYLEKRIDNLTGDYSRTQQLGDAKFSLSQLMRYKNEGETEVMSEDTYAGKNYDYVKESKASEFNIHGYDWDEKCPNCGSDDIEDTVGQGGTSGYHCMSCDEYFDNMDLMEKISNESKANEDDLDWTKDKPEGGIPFYCPLCHMTIEENATWDGVFDHNKQIHNMTDENAEILAKGFTYSNSPPTSFESKANEFNYNVLIKGKPSKEKLRDEFAPYVNIEDDGENTRVIFDGLVDGGKQELESLGYDVIGESKANEELDDLWMTWDTNTSSEWMITEEAYDEWKNYVLPDGHDASFGRDDSRKDFVNFARFKKNINEYLAGMVWDSKHGIVTNDNKDMMNFRVDESKANEYDCESCGGEYSKCPHCGHAMHDYEWEDSNDVCDSCEKGKYDESLANESKSKASEEEKCERCDGEGTLSGQAFDEELNNMHGHPEEIKNFAEWGTCPECDGKGYESYSNETDPCWKGYKQIGMKDKNGKQVPNCVPESKSTEESWGKDFYNSLKDEYGYHNWNDNNQLSSAHDQIKLMKDYGIADKTLRQMGYDLKKDGMEGFIDRIEKELSKFGINLDKPEEQEE